MFVLLCFTLLFSSFLRTKFFIFMFKQKLIDIGCSNGSNICKLNYHFLFAVQCSSSTFDFLLLLSSFISFSFRSMSVFLKWSRFESFVCFSSSFGIRNSKSFSFFTSNNSAKVLNKFMAEQSILYAFGIFFSFFFSSKKFYVCRDFFDS